MNRFRSQIREVINRNTVVSLALKQGYIAFLPVYDGGVDFILYRESDGDIKRVQLKSRWTIDKKYKGREIWIAFPIDDDWYLVEHDEMVSQAESEGITSTPSWIDGGLYSKPRPSAATKAKCAPYRFEAISKVAAEAAAEDVEQATQQHPLERAGSEEKV